MSLLKAKGLGWKMAYEIIHPSPEFIIHSIDLNFFEQSAVLLAQVD